jgi:hypothetical protein
MKDEITLEEALCDHFKKFVGREVHPLCSAPGVLQEIKEEAKLFGLRVHVCYPDLEADENVCGNSLTVSVKKEIDGAYRVSKDFKVD